MRIKQQSGIIAACLDATQLRQLAKIEPVLLIHGTFANAVPDDESAAWWMPGSSFARQLDVFLEERASAARCWADLRLGQPHTPAGPAHTSPRPFAWTGENSEAARRNGGRALAAQIAALERDPDVARYHLVGHSHGGNVILNALGELPRRPAKLGAVVFLGTPVLRFKDRDALALRWIAVPLYLAGLAALAWESVRSWPDYWFVYIPAGITIIVALVAEFRGPPSRSPAAADAQYGSGQPTAFVFPADEAIASLATARGIADNPARFIAQFLQSEEPKPPAVAPTAPPWPNPFRGIDQSGAAEVLARLNDGLDRIPVDLRWIPGLGGIIGIVQAVLWACVLLPTLVVLAVQMLLSISRRLCGLLWSAAWSGFATRLGQIALPVLVRKAVFGADRGRFQDVANLPPGVAEAAPISDALREEAARLSQAVGQAAGQAMVHAVASAEPFAIKTQVINALRNPALVHSHYYRSLEIIAQIAERIATTSKCPAPHGPGCGISPTAVIRPLPNTGGPLT